MNPTLLRVLLAFVFLAFMAVSGWATWEVGYIGILEAVFSGGPGILQVFFDLVVACGFGSVWLYRDARERGHNPWPWLLTVTLLGSIPLLAYVLVRDWLPGRAPALAEA